ncbi:MAG: DinB family protein [Terriglobia bacterium]
MTEQELHRHLEELEKNPERVAAAVAGLDDSVLRFKPAPGKWSILEILAHLADAELIWGYRIRQAIADKEPAFAPIDQDAWARNLGYTEASPAEWLALYQTNRRANLRLLRRLSLADLAKGGFHPELNRKFTLAETIERLAGHDPNHLGQIERLKQQATR